MNVVQLMMLKTLLSHTKLVNEQHGSNSNNNNGRFDKIVFQFQG